MPEGHSVHRLARQFDDVFSGARLAASSPQGRFAAGAARIDGRVLRYAAAHGKQLFLHFDHKLVLRTHLGLYGAWDFGGDESFNGASSIGAPRRMGEAELPGATAPADQARSKEAAAKEFSVPLAVPVNSRYSGPPEPVGAVRVRLVSDHGWADLRGPSACEVITTAEAAAAVARSGPDPLHNPPGAQAEFARRMSARNTAVGVLLMDQQVLAGVGNVYRAEVLFRQRLNPLLPGSTLSQKELGELWQDTVSVMSDGVRDGRIITTLPQDRAGAPVAAEDVRDAAALLPVEDAHYVYKRNSLPCRVCGTDIAMAELRGRTLYWCPTCQAAP